MKYLKGKCFMVVLFAGLTTEALVPRPLHSPVEQQEYLEADDWFEAGLAMNNAGRYQDAAEAFARSISIDPTEPLSWLNLGTAQALLGDYDRAIGNLKKSIQMNPKLALAFANLAEICFRTDRYQEAIDAYTELLALWPENPNALYKRGLAYLSLRDAGRAQAEYLSLKIVDPDLAEKLRQAINQGTAR